MIEPLVKLYKLAVLSKEPIYMDMEASEWITSILAAIAIVISLFSWWTARRNTLAAERNTLAAERSADAAIQSNEQIRIQYEAIQEKERKRVELFRIIYTKRLIKTAKEIHNAVLGKYQIDSPYASQAVVVDFESLRHVSHEIIYSDDILVDIFTEEEREKIDQAWSSLNHLIDEYGIEDTERQGIGYAGQVIGNFSQLIRKFEKQ